MNLNIKIDKISLKAARDRAASFLRDSGQYKIFTPNPEMYVLAGKDKKFLSVLNQGDLNICDGVGLSWFYKTLRISGADFMMDVCELSRDQDVPVYLLGTGHIEVLFQARDYLIKKYPGLRVVGYHPGPVIKEVGEEIEYDREENQKVIQKINDSGAGVLLVAYGMNKQEKWIVENLPKMPKIKIAMGIGGALDFIGGKTKRAPLLMRKIGLEWMYRLIREPRRIKRIWTATVVFLYKILCSKS